MTEQDWSRMWRGDFDESAPLALVEVAVARAAVPVPAVPDACGTTALFGEEPPSRPVAVRRRVQAEPPQPDALF
ncbi:hypothetical protein [Streptomyces sp. NPDC058657]|uniref:hypothetical protein n=1 Tax=unclassified Streptomyces TaxID=2593676 RepID=UPI003651A778